MQTLRFIARPSPGLAGCDRGRPASLARLLAIAVAAVALTAPRPIPAQVVGGSYRLLGQTTGGGGRSEGLGWSLAGSIATPVCALSLGGSFTLNGGLVGAWSVPGNTALVQIEPADGHARITFTGTLQSAPTVEGPWTDVDGATNPHDVIPTATARFFRSRQ